MVWFILIIIDFVRIILVQRAHRYYFRIRSCQTNHAAFFHYFSQTCKRKTSQHHQRSKIHQSTVSFVRKSTFTAWHSSQMTSLESGGCLLVLRHVTFDLQHALHARRHRLQQRASLLGVQADLLFLQRLPHRLSWSWLALLNPRLLIQPGVLNGVQVETATRYDDVIWLEYRGVNGDFLANLIMTWWILECWCC